MEETDGIFSEVLFLSGDGTSNKMGIPDVQSQFPFGQMSSSSLLLNVYNWTWQVTKERKRERKTSAANSDRL